jgi:hypothetical protein
MTLPEVLINQNIFYTDIKSLLRGLNSLDGSTQSRIRAIRVDKNGFFFKATGVYTLIKICLIASISERESVLSSEIKGIYYDDQEDTYNLLRHLSNDSKEAILLKENIDGYEFLKTISKTILMRTDNSNYMDLYSACIDSFQINNGIVFLYHDLENNMSYILNRALVPNPENNYDSFLLFTKFILIKETDKINSKHNFLQIGRKSLEVTSEFNTKNLDLTQLILPIIHIYKDQI